MGEQGVLPEAAAIQYSSKMAVAHICENCRDRRVAKNTGMQIMQGLLQ
jgi:hypothetical protein